MGHGQDISKILLRKIFDSSGNPTVEAEVRTSSGACAIASAPSGKSKGKTEVSSFPTGGVDAGIKNFAKIAKTFTGQPVLEQEEIDGILSSHIPMIGGNVSTAVSIAVAKAAALSLGVELYQYVHDSMTKKHGIRLCVPRPLGNIIGGGVHSQNSGMTIQEILVAAETQSAERNITINSDIHRLVGRLAAEFVKSPIGVNIERAWILPYSENDSLQLVHTVKEEMEKKYGARVTIGIDFAASSFYHGGGYKYRSGVKTADEQLDFVRSVLEKYDVRVLEDPFDEEDYGGFARLTKLVGRKALVVGDDLYTTNWRRISVGGERKATNAALIKVNQIGTLSDTVKAVATARRSGMETIISHRSSETTDPFIAHLGAAFGCRYIKTGTVGGERVAKLNELMRIDALIGGK